VARSDPGGQRRSFARIYRWASNVLYGRLAWAYDAISWLVGLGQWAAWRGASIAHVEGSRVLDIGFGTGELLIEMAESGLDPYGLELSAAMQAVTARKLRRRGISLPRVRALAQAMPFADGSFDSAVATFPAWYILDATTLREVARVVRWRRAGSGQGTGRFIVAGLITGMRNRAPSDRASLQLSRTNERILSHYQHLADQAGLDVAIVTHRFGRWQVPIAISTKRKT